jgi:hypothetical protein
VPVSVGVARVAEDAQASEAALRAALEENARLREQQGLQAVELERLRADLAVLQRLLFGRSSERMCPESGGGDVSRVALGVVVPIAPGPATGCPAALWTTMTRTCTPLCSARTT